MAAVVLLSRPTGPCDSMHGHAWTISAQVMASRPYYRRQSTWNEWRRVSHCPTNWWTFLFSIRSVCVVRPNCTRQQWRKSVIFHFRTWWLEACLCWAIPSFISWTSISCSFPLLFVSHSSLHILCATQSKWPRSINLFAHNFATCWLNFKFLSLLNSVGFHYLFSSKFFIGLTHTLGLDVAWKTDDRRWWWWLGM